MKNLPETKTPAQQKYHPHRTIWLRPKATIQLNLAIYTLAPSRKNFSRYALA